MIKLTTDEIAIFGRPNFACAGLARLLIETKVYEDLERSAEYEQAVCIHWTNNIFIENGENWRVVRKQKINDLFKKARI